MKATLLSLLFFCLTVALRGQGPFSSDEALKQLYRDYDPASKTAHWVCTQEQQSNGPHRGWPCVKEDTTVSVSVILIAQVSEGDDTKTYLATSAKPTQDSTEYSCHACAPAIGAAVFVWNEQRWELESANAGIEFSGSWGNPPEVGLIAVGPTRHGILLSSDHQGQGFHSSLKNLLVPLGKSVEEVWSLEDEGDDSGAIDPNDKANSPAPYRWSAAFRLIAGDEADSEADEYYDIEVFSRGTSWSWGHPVKPENWTAVYTFKDGKYRLSRRTVFTEAKSPAKPAKR